MSSTRPTFAKEDLTASETLIAMASPKRKDTKIEAKAYTKANPPPSSGNDEILPSKSSTTTSSRSPMFPRINNGASASIVTPKSTVKTPRATCSRHAAARAVSATAASRIAAVENSATKQQVKAEPEAEDTNEEAVTMETPIFRRGTTADNSTAVVKPSEASTKLRDLTSPSTVALPLLTLRSAYNDNTAHQREQEQSEDDDASSISSNTTTNNTLIYNGVAEYVENAAEDDIKTKLLMEINDLKQLLSGRKAQVDSLTASNSNLEDKIHRLQGMERQNKKQRLTSRSSTPTRFVGEEQHAKIVKSMQLQALQDEAVVRGVDADIVTPMSREALLETLVIGTTCITKSSAWSEVVSLQAEIENEKVAIRLQENDEKQRLVEMERKRDQKREKRSAARKREQDAGIVPSSMIVTDAGTAFTRDGMKALEMATKIVCKSELQKDTFAATTNPAKRPRGRPRKSAKKPSFGKRGSAFGNIAKVSSTNNYPSLAAEDDDQYTHPSHAIIRRDILEAFVTVAPKADEDVTGEGRKKTARRRRYAGKVGFRCRYCKDKSVDEQGDLSVIYPESISGLYRANIRFQSKHIQACKHIPQELRDELEYLKTCKDGMNRGNKNYWTESALTKGFRDWVSADGGKKGIIYCPELNEELKSSDTH